MARTPSTRNDEDELRSLKEGDVYVREDGKKFRVHKTVLPQRSGGGPAGYGDPDDRTLRKIEMNAIVPELMRKRIDAVECRDSYLEMMGCIKREGQMVGPSRCRKLRDAHVQCIKEKFEDSDFRKMITDLYLDERSEFRRTGRSRIFRQLDEYHKRRNEGKSK